MSRIQRLIGSRVKRALPIMLCAAMVLMVLEFESTLVVVAASNLAGGVDLTQADRDRLMLAKQRISAIVDEVTG